MKVALAVTAALIVAAATSGSAQEEPSPYRLSGNFKPSRYDVELDLSGDYTIADPTFTGKVIITFECVKASASIDLHAVGITVTTASLKQDDTDIELKTPEPAHAEHEIMQIETTTATLEANKVYTLTIEYTGTLWNDNYGIYVSKYKDAAGVDVTIATTQFQATYARRAFPCFDEPAYKAVFKLAITVPNKPNWHALANTQESAPAQNNIFTFQETVVMSSYLIAFVVSPFKSIGYTRPDGNEYRIWARDNAIANGQFALGVTPDIVAYLDEYTALPYWTKASRGDQVAISDFAAGAMENWGLITYRESNLLWNKMHNTARNQQRIATVISHEYAHMWFGNLITTFWWSATWLNEGFARFFEYRATDAVKPEWELPKQFVVEQQQTIFVADSIDTAQPLTSPTAEVSSPKEISEKFASITYSKGGAVLRMAENILGQEKFREGLQTYLKDNQHDVTTPAQLWGVFGSVEIAEKVSKPMALIMENWTDKPGYPIVYVKKNGMMAEFTQKRYLFPIAEEGGEGEEEEKGMRDGADTTWYVPLAIMEGGKDHADDTTIDAWLQPDDTEPVAVHAYHTSNDFIIVNVNGAGYFRVNYDTGLWNQLASKLKSENHAGIGDVSRAQLVDDIMNLARIDEVDYGRAINLVRYLNSETSYYPWYAAFQSFAYLRRRLAPESETAQSLNGLIDASLDEMYHTVSFDIPATATHLDLLRTALVLQWACDLDMHDCRDNAYAQFESWRTVDAHINPNLRSVVYCNGLRVGNSTQYNKLLEHLKGDATNDASEFSTVVSGLGCSLDEDNLKSFLEMTLDPTSGVRAQDRISVFNSVLNGNPSGVEVALVFCEENFEKIRTEYQSMNAFTGLLTNLADRLTTQEQLDRYAAMIEEHNTLLSALEKQVADRAMLAGKANLLWAEANEKELFNALRSSAAATSFSICSLIVATVVAIRNLM